MKKLTIEAENDLEKYVKKWINKKATEYEKGVEGVIDDLMQGGCASGYVGELIYYKDTCAFFKKFKDEISELLKEAISNCGTGAKDVFGDKWDETDPLAQEDQNQNLLAWFGFEETARNLCLRANIDC